MTQEGFKNIFDGHFDSVRNYVYYRSGDPELATDIAQETFMKVWEKQLHTGSNHITALLFKIAGDLFVSCYRKQKVALNFKLNVKPEVTGGISPEDQMRFQELNDRYNKALNELPEKQRIVFLMSRLDGLKYHEIAEKLGLSVKAVEKRMKNALAFLKKVLVD